MDIWSSGVKGTFEPRGYLGKVCDAQDPKHTGD
jgi:hypothetical protein